MPRSPTYSPTCTINFQTDERTRDALHAAARRQERSASAVIRLAIRAWLNGQAAPTAPQHGDSPQRSPNETYSLDSLNTDTEQNAKTRVRAHTASSHS